MSEIDIFLGTYSDAVQNTAEELRLLIQATVPECSETLHSGWKVISYGTTGKFCAIAPHARWVNLQFHAGAELHDPDGLLQGTGKSMRHVKVLPDEPLPAGLIELLVAAARQ